MNSPYLMLIGFCQMERFMYQTTRHMSDDPTGCIAGGAILAEPPLQNAWTARNIARPAGHTAVISPMDGRRLTGN